MSCCCRSLTLQSHSAAADEATVVAKEKNRKDTIAEEVSDVTITLAEEASEAVREKVDAEEILRNKDSGQEQKEQDLVLQCQTPLLSLTYHVHDIKLL